MRKALITAIFCAVALFVQASKTAPSPFQKAVEFYNGAKYQEAITQFRAAHKAGIQPANSVYYIALCYQQLGDLKQAHESYKFVCTRYPNSAVADRSFKMLKETGMRLAEMEETENEEGPKVSTTSGAGPILKEKEEKPSRLREDYGPGAFVVKFTEDAMDGRMYVDGKINGKKCKLLFDTGAGVAFCRQSFLNKEKMELGFIKEVDFIPGALKEAPAKVAIVKIAVGNLVREDKLYVEQDSPDNVYPSFDNCPIIGQSFFGDLSYEVDGKSNLIIFRRATGKIAKGKTAPIVKLGAREIPFKRDGSHIIVKAKINGKDVEMILDTGASQVVFADRHLAQSGLNRPVDATNNIRRTVDGRRDSYAFTVDNIILGPIAKQEVDSTVLVNSKFSKPLLGQSFLRDLRYTVDPVRNVIRFEQ